MTLPHELNADQRRMLMTDFARSLARQESIVDVSIHEPDVHSDERNYHAHMLLGMYRIDENNWPAIGGHGTRWNQKKWYKQVHERWSQKDRPHLRERPPGLQEAGYQCAGAFGPRRGSRHKISVPAFRWRGTEDRIAASTIVQPPVERSYDFAGERF